MNDNPVRVTSAKSLYQRKLKRVIDLTAAILLLILLSPLFVILTIVIRIAIGSPVLFRQERPGKHGKIFEIRKFRTMSEKRDKDGRLLPDEQRITGIGRFIRSSSLDELPELVNVLKGEMSLVGPRPLMPQYLNRYTARQARRHEVTPGITGWVQVNGRNRITWEEKFELDVWYVEHQSFFLDTKILIRTVGRVLTRDGISEEGFVAASEFMGSEDGRDDSKRK